MEYKYAGGGEAFLLDRFTEGKTYIFEKNGSTGLRTICDYGLGLIFALGEVGKYGFVPISHATNSPVRTETITRTVIEPGVYGRLELCKGDDGKIRATLTSNDDSDGMWDLLSSDEWRELARIATELADGLDAQ